MSICNKSYLQLPNTELWSCKQLFVVLLRIITIVLLTIFHSEFTTHLWHDMLCRSSDTRVRVTLLLRTSPLGLLQTRSWQTYFGDQCRKPFSCGVSESRIGHIYISRDTSARVRYKVDGCSDWTCTRHEWPFHDSTLLLTRTGSAELTLKDVVFEGEALARDFDLYTTMKWCFFYRNVCVRKITRIIEILRAISSAGVRRHRCIDIGPNTLAVTRQKLWSGVE